MSCPILFLFYLWGGILPPVDAVGRGISIHSLNFQHIGYVSSIISFYFLPFILEKNLKLQRFLNINVENKKIIFTSFLIFIIYFLFFYDLSKEFNFGNGVFFKLSSLLFVSQVYQKIFLAIVFIISLFIILRFLKKDFYNYFILAFLIFSSIIYKPVLQEYFDPLMIILIFTFLSTNFLFKRFNLMVCYLYFISFLIFSNIYYYKLCLTSSLC